MLTGRDHKSWLRVWRNWVKKAAPVTRLGPYDNKS
jgi:hypothetical protein